MKDVIILSLVNINEILVADVSSLEIKECRATFYLLFFGFESLYDFIEFRTR